MKYLLKILKNNTQNFIQNNFLPFWIKMIESLRRLTMFLTFLNIVVGVVFIAYDLFLCYNVIRATTTCLMLITMVFVNNKLQS